MGRTGKQRRGFASVDARKRAAAAHEPPGASGGEGGDGDEPPLQKRLRDGVAETVSAGPLSAHAASSSRRVYGDGSRWS